MQNVPWYMDLVGAGFTNHGSNQGGILIETESGGHVELVNADPAHTTHGGHARALLHASRSSTTPTATRPRWASCTR